MTLKTKIDLISVKLKFTVYFIVFFTGRHVWKVVTGCLIGKIGHVRIVSLLMISKTDVKEVCGTSNGHFIPVYSFCSALVLHPINI